MSCLPTILAFLGAIGLTLSGFQYYITGYTVAIFFLSHLYESTGSCCCHFDMGVSVSITIKSFVSKIFYVMGKGLTGLLHYPVALELKFIGIEGMSKNDSEHR